MKRIEISKLIIKDFKGIKSLVIEPKNVTDIFGANGICKTTIFDAYIWCLFGKNSNDESDFNIKTLDANNEAIHYLEHTVEVQLMIYENESSPILRVFKRVYKEDWTKPRGQANEIFSGHTTNYWINDVPMSQKEYKDRIAEIIPEQTFRILSNPLYFNTQLKWDARRPILFKLVQDIKDTVIALGNTDFEWLLKEISNINISEFKKMVAAKLKVLNDEIKVIAPKIDELSKQMPEVIDEHKVNSEIQLIESEINKIDSTLSSQTERQKEANNINANIQKEIGELRLKLHEEEGKIRLSKQSEKAEISIKISGKQNEIQSVKSQLLTLSEQKDKYTRDFESKNTLLTKLRADFKAENEKELVFDEASLFTCPACNRLYESDDIETKKFTLSNNFNSHKSQILEKINQEGLAVKSQLEQLNSNYKDIQDASLIENEKLTKLETEMKSLLEAKTAIELKATDNQVCESVLTAKYISEINQLEAKIQTQIPTESTTDENEIKELKQNKINLSHSISLLNQKLGTVNAYNSFVKRIEELKQLQQSLGQQIADIEKKQYIASEFERKKITATETLLNSNFSFVKFKMFNTLVNGNIEDTCECLVNGVNFSDLNTAARLNAGIDIINTLSKHFNISLPLILDNRESVTDIINFTGQLMNLRVSKDDAVLRIESK